MEEYLNELRRRAGRDLEKRAEGVLRKLESARRATLGFEKTPTKTIIPFPPVTTASIGSATRLPTSVPKYEVTLLPNAKISPTVGIGMGGIQTRLVIKRNPEGVPKDSIVGTGLENQKAVTGGADLSVKPRE